MPELKDLLVTVGTEIENCEEVVWKVAPLFATWISQTSNLLFRNDILHAKSSVLELGCGISGITALAMRSLVGSYLLTDQTYVMKLLNQNLEENSNMKAAKLPTKKSKGRNINGCKKNMGDDRSPNYISNISAIPLDWETDEVTHQLSEVSQNKGFDVIVATDCIYNDALIQPLVNTCADACKLRSLANGLPTVCIFAQQLRSFEVFEKWLKSFSQKFIVWRVLDSELTEGLRMGSGFVVHLGIL
ncbi:hypothetical protein EPUL_003424, partial [Erysiphe pulchra]